MSKYQCLLNSNHQKISLNSFLSIWKGQILNFMNNIFSFDSLSKKLTYQTTTCSRCDVEIIDCWVFIFILIVANDDKNLIWSSKFSKTFRLWVPSHIRRKMSSTVGTKVTRPQSAMMNPAGSKSLLVFVVLALCCILGFSSRLFAVIRFESIIHEFDPW